MHKIFDFSSKADHYVADAAVLSCFDYRIRDAVAEFLRTRGIRNPDMIIVAGGAKALASPANAFEREFVLEQVRLSIRLHDSKRVLLIVHSDCGAYGGLGKFNGDTAAEMDHHHKELRRAAELISQTFSEIRVEPCFVNFDGIWTGEPDR